MWTEGRLESVGSYTTDNYLQRPRKIKKNPIGFRQ